MRIHSIVRTLLVIACGLSASPLLAQSFPSRPIRMLTPVAAGAPAFDALQSTLIAAEACVVDGQLDAAESRLQTVAQQLGVGGGQEVTPLDQHVGRNGQMLARAGRDQRTVVAPSQHRVARRAFEVTVDQFKLTHDSQAIVHHLWPV